MIAATRAIIQMPQRHSARSAAAPADQPQTGRELMVIAPVAADMAAEMDTPRPSRRPSAAFLAQLIATDRKFPQTRARNRAEPHEAIAAYGAATRMVKYTAS